MNVRSMNVYDWIKCPKCGEEARIEKREEIVWCKGFNCAFYFNREGQIGVALTRTNASSRPLWDSLPL